MKLLDERTIQCKDKQFTLKLFATNNCFTVIAFLGDEQVSPSYSVDLDTHIDYFMQHKARLTENIFALAKSDIEQGMYYKS